MDKDGSSFRYLGSNLRWVDDQFAVQPTFLSELKLPFATALPFFIERMCRLKDGGCSKHCESIEKYGALSVCLRGWLALETLLTWDVLGAASVLDAVGVSRIVNLLKKMSAACLTQRLVSA